MDKYADIKKNIMEYAERDEDIKSIVVIGSSAREEVTADVFSDLDFIIATENTEKWIIGEYPQKFGNVSISFIEPTLGGGKERRIIYEEDKDVDMIIFTPEQFADNIKNGVAQWVMNRGYEVIYDSGGFTELIKQYVSHTHSNPEMSEAEYRNLVNDFYFHNIWVFKKLKRGEIWAAKMCVDGYLKNHLLKMMELYCFLQDGRDVWHEGRFLDQWAEDNILKELKNCFAHYKKDDIMRALRATQDLFDRIARGVAEMLGYDYPAKAKECAEKFINGCNQS